MNQKLENRIAKNSQKLCLNSYHELSLLLKMNTKFQGLFLFLFELVFNFK